MTKLLKISILYLISLFSFTACHVGEHDYMYTVVNNNETPIVLHYKTMKDTAKVDTLQMGEELTIAQRYGVKSEEVWDVETSVSLYKVETLVIYSLDSTKSSEELCYRKHWTGPETKDGKGIYKLPVDKNILLMTMQNGYVYKVVSPFEDSLRVTANLKDYTLKVDTIITQKQSVVIGETNIFSYDESYAETEKYKIQKITGLRSITLRHGTDYKNLNLTKDTAYFKTEKDTCYLIVTEDMFASTTKK